MSLTSMKGGVLVVDKPAGPTSFAVVDRVRRALGASKAGHTGTLDPLATGVLAVCLDDAVKVQQYITSGDKSYQAEVSFGSATDTEDAAGRVVERGDPSRLDAAAVAAVLPRFTGEVLQVPPMYSAVRVGGRRLHEAARRGEVVERAPRTVRVHALALLSFEPGPERALARLAVDCGKGTYVRTLAADIGRALGVPAHLAVLRRTAAGPFTLAQSTPLDEVESMARSDPSRLVSPAEALSPLPEVRLAEPDVAALAQGRVVPREAPGPLCRALGPDGGLVAICVPAAGGIRPSRVFVQVAGIPRKPGTMG
jgi:tRNA pseudouridine55 synthase